jgi:beta-lactam-binding protein with PASTA domain
VKRVKAHGIRDGPAHRGVVQLQADIDVQRVILVCLNEGPDELIVDQDPIAGKTVSIAVRVDDVKIVVDVSD